MHRLHQRPIDALGCQRGCHLRGSSRPVEGVVDDITTLPQAKQLARSKGATAAGGKQPAPGMSAEETGGAYYRKYILQDLEPWAEHGITEVLHATLMCRSVCGRLREAGRASVATDKVSTVVVGGMRGRAADILTHTLSASLANVHTSALRLFHILLIPARRPALASEPVQRKFWVSSQGARMASCST